VRERGRGGRKEKVGGRRKKKEKIRKKGKEKGKRKIKRKREREREKKKKREGDHAGANRGRRSCVVTGRRAARDGTATRKKRRKGGTTLEIGCRDRDLTGRFRGKGLRGLGRFEPNDKNFEMKYFSA